MPQSLTLLALASGCGQTHGQDFWYAAQPDPLFSQQYAAQPDPLLGQQYFYQPPQYIPAPVYTSGVYQAPQTMQQFAPPLQYIPAPAYVPEVYQAPQAPQAPANFAPDAAQQYSKTTLEAPPFRMEAPPPIQYALDSSAIDPFHAQPSAHADQQFQQYQEYQEAPGPLAPAAQQLGVQLAPAAHQQKTMLVDLPPKSPATLEYTRDKLALFKQKVAYEKQADDYMAAITAEFARQKAEALSQQMASSNVYSDEVDQMVTDRLEILDLDLERQIALLTQHFETRSTQLEARLDQGDPHREKSESQLKASLANIDRQEKEQLEGVRAAAKKESDKFERAKDMIKTYKSSLESSQNNIASDMGIYATNIEENLQRNIHQLL